MNQRLLAGTLVLICVLWGAAPAQRRTLPRCAGRA